MNENNKNTIEETALSLFMKKGYSSVGVQEICDESGVTKPTLYHYFGSKAGLLDHIVSSRGTRLLDSLGKELEYRHDFIGCLNKALKAMVAFAMDEKEYFSLHCALLSAPEGSEAKEVYRPYGERLNGLFLAFFQNSTKEYGNMRGREKLYSALFSNLLLSTSTLVLAGEIQGDDNTLSRIVHSFVYGVAS